MPAEGAVLALGDSILCGPEEGAFGVPPRAWPQWLAEALDLPFHRLARPGALSEDVERWFVPRLRDDYALACVGVGTNDVRSLDWDPRSFAASLGRLLRAAGEREGRRGELLHHAVVQRTRDPPALRVGGVDRRPQQPFALGLAALQAGHQGE